MSKIDEYVSSLRPFSPSPAAEQTSSSGSNSNSSTGSSSSGERTYKNPFYNSSKPTNALNSPKASVNPLKFNQDSFNTSAQDYGANLAAAESALEQARNNMYGATDPFSEAELRKEFEAAQAKYDEAKRQAQDNAHRFMQQAAKDIAEQQGLPDISNLSQQSIAQGPQPMQELIPGRGQKPVYDNTLARTGNWLGESVKAGGLGAAAGYTGTARVAQEASEEAQIARNFDSATEAAWSLAKEYASQLSDPETAEERKDAIFRFETELKGFCDALGDGVYDQVVANARRAAEEIIKPETDLDELYNNFNSGVSVDETNFQKATKATSKLANELSAMSEESTEAAKEIIAPLKISGVLTDATINAVQMAIDGAISTAAVSIGGFNAATKGAIGLGSMFTRAAGSKAQQAEAAGASFNQQVAAAALSGGVEVLTEKLADGLAGLYGKGTSDEIVNEIIRKLCSNDQGRAALSFLANGASEAIEEVLSGAAEPAIDSIYNEDAKKAYTTSEGRKELISDIGYSALIGFILGEAGGTVEAATGGVAETVEQMRETDAVQNNLVENGMSEKDARKAAPAVVKALSNEDLTKAQKKAIANPIVQSLFGEQIDAAKAAAQNAIATASTTPAPAPEQAQAEGRTAPAQAAIEVASTPGINAAAEVASTPIETATEEMPTPEAAQPTVEAQPAQVAAETTTSSNPLQARVDAILNSGKVTNSQANEIINNPELRAAFEAKTGNPLVGTKSEQRKQIKAAAEIASQPAQTTAAESAPQPEAVRSEGKTAPATEATEAEAAQPINAAEEVASEEAEIPTEESPVQDGESTQKEQQEETAKEEQPESEETAGEEQEESETKSESDETVPPEEPTGEPTGSTYEELAEEYGIIEPGEKPTREANTPKRTAESNKVSESTRTVIEAGVTPESRLSDIKAAVSEGRFSYIPIKNSDIAADARARVEAKGWRKAVTDWTNAIREGKASAELVAEGAVILNNAANNEECSGAEYIDLMVDYVRLNRAMGRGLQAARILKTLSPEGKLYAFQRVVENMNDDISEMQKNLGKNYTIPQNLVEEYRNQTTDEGRDAVIDKMQKAIAAQMPSTFADKLTALRYLNMLGNLKTQVRNILGNTGMMAVQKAKNILRAGIETVASAATGGKIEKQASAFYGRDLARAAFNDFRNNQDVQAEGMGERKYSSPSQEYIRGISENKEVFKYGDNKLTRALGIAGKQGPVLKALSLYQKGTTWAMEMGDQVFVTLNYTDALAGYLQAHKITAEQWKSLVTEAEANPTSESADTVDKARSYAIKQAQEATFRDSNKISEFAQNFDKNWGKAKIITQGIAPFRKTPANVGVRMEEYSPLGFANAIVKGVQAAKGKNNVTGTDVIDSLSKAMTGTGLAYLGWMLAAAGKARTKSDDDDQEAFDKLRGLQDYSVTINGTNFTLDWAVPAAAALFMGVEGYNNLMDGNLTGDELMQVLGNLTSPMLQMSMLSGLNDALNNLSSFNDDADALPQFLLNSAWSYLTQGFTNTLLGQVEQANEKYRQTYYTESESKIPTSAQKKLAQAGNKTPGVDFQSADYIDAWGRKVENPSNIGERYLNALLNPSYVSNLEKSSTAVDDELQRLFEYGKEQDRFPDVFPNRTSRNTSVKGTKLSPEEYDVYATTKGQKSLELVTDLIGSKAYEALSDDAKAEAISECYSFARYLAGKEIADSRGEDYESDYQTLLTGVDKSGAAYDKTGLNASNFTAYTAFKMGVDDAVDKQDYEALDKLVSDYNKQNKNLQTVLNERNPVLRALTKWKDAGLDSKTYYSVQQELVKSQRKLDKSQKTGSAVELDALANINLPEATKKRLIDSLEDYGSKTVTGVYDVLYDYGFNSKQINEFWNNSQNWVNKDTGEAQSSQKAGTLQPLEAAYAIQQLPGLTPQQMSEIYNKLKEVAHNPYKINDWGNWTFSSEKNYLDSGRSYQQFGSSKSTSQEKIKNPFTSGATAKTNKEKANALFRTP